MRQPQTPRLDSWKMVVLVAGFSALQMGLVIAGVEDISTGLFFIIAIGIFLRLRHVLGDGPNPQAGSRTNEPVVTVPPGFAEMILAVAAKTEHREGIVGDAAQKYADNVKKFGRKRASRLYWIEAICSIAPLLKRAIKRLGVATLLVDAFRRFFGGA